MMIPSKSSISGIRIPMTVTRPPRRGKSSSCPGRGGRARRIVKLGASRFPPITTTRNVSTRRGLPLVAAGYAAPADALATAVRRRGPRVAAGCTIDRNEELVGEAGEPVSHVPNGMGGLRDVDPPIGLVSAACRSRRCGDERLGPVDRRRDDEVDVEAVDDFDDANVGAAAVGQDEGFANAGNAVEVDDDSRGVVLTEEEPAAHRADRTRSGGPGEQDAGAELSGAPHWPAAEEQRRRHLGGNDHASPARLGRRGGRLAQVERQEGDPDAPSCTHSCKHLTAECNPLEGRGRRTATKRGRSAWG